MASVCLHYDVMRSNSDSDYNQCPELELLARRHVRLGALLAEHPESQLGAHFRSAQRRLKLPDEFRRRNVELSSTRACLTLPHTSALTPCQQYNGGQPQVAIYMPPVLLLGSGAQPSDLIRSLWQIPPKPQLFSTSEGF